MNDWDYVNFSQDHELNYHLEKVNKRNTESNRSTLIMMGNTLKTTLNKKVLTHSEFGAYKKEKLVSLD